MFDACVCSEKVAFLNVWGLFFFTNEACKIKSKSRSHFKSFLKGPHILSNPEEKFIIVIIFHEMNHKDEKVTLFNNVFCAFIINQGFSLFGYSFGRKTALYSILNCSSHLKVCTSNTSTLPFLWAGRVIGMAVDSNALALLCL